MRRQLILAFTVALALGLVGAIAPIARADESANSFFYDQLAPYGNWMDNPRYGEVWKPNNLPDDWRPYSDGRWVDTDEGMTWVSDADWGWITFHYGRWYFDPAYGWVWVPGTVWSPGWVAWREGPGFVGWAALPPDFGWEPWFGGVGLAFAFDDIGFFWWSFVDDDELFEHHFHDGFRHFDRDGRFHRLAGDRDDRWFAADRDRGRFFNETTNVTRFRVANGRAVDESFNDAQLTRLVGHQVRHENVNEALGERRGGREMDRTFQGMDTRRGMETRRALPPGGRIEGGNAATMGIAPRESDRHPLFSRPSLGNPGSEKPRLAPERPQMVNPGRERPPVFANPSRERPQILNPGRSFEQQGGQRFEQRGGQRMFFNQAEPRGSAPRVSAPRSQGFFGRIFGGSSAGRERAAGSIRGGGSGGLNVSHGGSGNAGGERRRMN